MPHFIANDDTGAALEACLCPLNGPPLTPPALSGNVNDYAPAGIQSASVLRVATGGAPRTITGIVAPTGGKAKWLLVLNTDSVNSLTLSNADAGSAAANQIIGSNAANVIIRKLDCVFLWYDPVLLSWIVVQI